MRLIRTQHTNILQRCLKKKTFYNVMFEKSESHTVAGSKRQPTKLNISLQPNSSTIKD